MGEGGSEEVREPVVGIALRRDLTLLSGAGLRLRVRRVSSEFRGSFPDARQR